MSRRTKALVIGAVLTVFGAAAAIGVYRQATREQRELDRAFGPGAKVLVADGNLYGLRWKIFAHAQDGRPCLVAKQELFSGGSCFRPGQVAGAAVDFTVWTGTIELKSGRVLRYAAVVGAAPPQVARVRILFRAGAPFDVHTVEFAGFGARFFVRVVGGGLPEGPGLVEAFDARGRPVPPVPVPAT